MASIPPGPGGAVLTIVVVNAREDSSEPVRQANAESMRVLGAELGPPEKDLAGGAALYRHGAGKLMVVDRSDPSNLLPAKQGVGLARKIGADIALACVVLGVIRSHWIHCTDADVHLPLDYFEQSDRAASSQDRTDTTAWIYRFHHRLEGSARQRRAIADYEASLRYYVLGLRFSESPYAFHSIGSTLAIRADAYAQVRGFPRRNAAEDFYLLNKLAKVGSIRALGGDPIELSGRTSDRVPFGTGPAIGRAVAVNGPDSTLQTYDPRAFAYLRGWIRALDFLGEPERRGDPLEQLERSTEQAIGEATDLNPERLISALHATGSLRNAEHIASHSPHENLRRKLHEAFDGYRTMKLIHALRDGGLPNLPLDEALQRAPFIALSETTHPDAMASGTELSRTPEAVRSETLWKLDYESAP